MCVDLCPNWDRNYRAWLPDNFYMYSSWVDRETKLSISFFIQLLFSLKGGSRDKIIWDQRETLLAPSPLQLKTDNLKYHS